MTGSSSKRRLLGGYTAERRGNDVLAPAWTDAAACAALEALNEVRGRVKQRPYLIKVAADGCLPDDLLAALARRAPSADHAAIAEQVLTVHVGRVAVAARKGVPAAKAAADNFLRSWKRRAKCVRDVKEVTLPKWEGKPTRSIGSFISKKRAKDRVRSVARWRKTMARLRAWPRRPLKTPSVVQPERSRRRELYERGGKADAAFLRGCEHRVVLPTLTGNRGNHWFWLHLLRPVSLQETLRAQGCEATRKPPASAPAPEAPLMLALGKLGDIAALDALGRAVHLESGRFVLRRLLQRRSRQRAGLPITYGSAFSGIDTLAAALDGVLGGTGWRHEFLAELDKDVRDAATAAWRTRGLDPQRAHADARLLASETWVELFTATSECNEFARTQQDPDHARQGDSLFDLSESLEYVRRRHPHLVLLENVDEPIGCIPISGLLGSISEYDWERLVVCPYEHLGWPVRRKRSFWLGSLKQM